MNEKSNKRPLSFKKYNYQCIAKTQIGQRCRKKSLEGYFLCHLHHNATINFFNQVKLVEQNGGYAISDIYKSAFNFALPSCLDILQCDWITDISNVIPGLPLLMNLMSY